MNRFIRISTLFFTVVLVISVLAVSVSAADTYFDSSYKYINLLDYNTINNSGSNFVNPPQGYQNYTFFIHTPETMVLNDVDFVFQTDASNLRMFVGSKQLTVEHISGTVYRVYGAIPGNGYSSISVLMNYDWCTWFRVVSFNVSPLTVTRYSSSVDFDLNGTGYNSFPSTSSFEIYGSSSYVNAMPLLSSFKFNDWRKFDYVEITLMLSSAMSINNISAVFDNSMIPAETNVFLSSGGELTQYESGTLIKYENPNNLFYVTVKLDLRDLDRYSSSVPIINIFGQFDNSRGYRCDIVGVYGHLQGGVNPLYYYFRDFTSDLQSMFTDLRTGIVTYLGYINQNIVTWGTNIRNSINDMSSAVTDRLDQLIGGSTEGDELTQDSEQISSGVENIGQFEQSQQAVLDNNFQAIQNTVTLTGFTAALAFVQRYSNMVFEGIKGYSIVYTLPIFLGLFFYLCSRVPGVTRWRSKPPKERDST